ncbi:MULTISPECIES: glycosyltransferase family 2 protein [unclassified Halorubrum]|uniref:glycosyltransferase family 2 protein n=1 Tax=unclassified Halorubrum TaxID=2642239 RepID=UPI000B998B73|nr:MULTISPECIES: glycosyltransferase family 2 protein [unclassified Halorubrum]OYR45092.1 glycosyl transferase family 2 [Halorubrum sp. Hd13]OYR50835.1 glycosyl transferase family 2 [Halorubrum sp. Ea8]
MDLSVVVPTLNGRDRLGACLDALATHAPEAEVIVANGPSADGTTGMVRDRDDVDVLVEISDRTVNVARNAGIEVATGDAVALVDFDNRIGEEWPGAVRAGLADAAAVTGPVTPAEPSRRPEAGGNGEQVSADGERVSADEEAGDGSGDDAADEPPVGPERRTIAGRDVTYFAGGNVAFRRETLRDIDGFDEYLRTGGARDAAHRLARMGHEIAWREALGVTKELPSPTAADGGRSAHEWGWKYRALAYRLLKNYGVRPTVMARVGSHAATDAVDAAADVVRGESTPSRWAANGRDVLVGLASGGSDGLVARGRDRSPARNPNGISERADRAVAKYDRREREE